MRAACLFPREREHDDGWLHWVLVRVQLYRVRSDTDLSSHFSVHFSAHPHGRKSMYALMMGIGSYLFLSVSMWNCVYVKIDGYLDAEFPFIERVSTEVRCVKHSTLKVINYATFASLTQKCLSFNRHSCIHLR